MGIFFDGAFSDAYTQLPGLRLHCVTAGPANGAPVILLHGFPDFWYSWRFQIPALADAGYRVIVPDQRGYNLSDKQGPYDFITLARDIANLQDALTLSPSHIIGHDWGGGVAWAFAALYPERTNKLIIMNAPHYNAYEDTVRHHLRQVLKSWYILFFQIPFLPVWTLRRNHFAFLDYAFRQVNPRYMTAKDISQYKEACAQPGAVSAMIGWYRYAARYLVSHTGRFPNFHITRPTCVIWGVQDFALDTACNDTLGRYVEQLETHYLPEAGHWVQMDQPEEVNRLVLQFLLRDK